MLYTDLITGLLDKQKLEFEIVHTAEVSTPAARVQMAAWHDDRGCVLALYPSGFTLDANMLKESLHRNSLIKVNTDDFAQALLNNLSDDLFECNNQNGWQAIIDAHLTQQDYVYFETSDIDELIQIRTENFENLTSDCLLGLCFTRETSQQPVNTDRIRRLNIREKIECTKKLPALPVIAKNILALRNNPNATISDLVAIVESDLSLTAQILRYANSALFSSEGPVHTLKDAIFRVLGYETVMHISLGYALGKSFHLPTSGPLGQEAFWQQSVFSATLMHRLTYAMPQAIRPKPGMAYLAGLLHDIGLLVLNMYFKDEYLWFNKLLAADTQKSVVETEQKLLGVTHNELGAWLMKAWNLPEEIIISVENHHDTDYQGPHEIYTLLVNLTERLLKTHGISYADSDDIPDELLDKLQLDAEEVFQVMDEVLQGRNTLKSIVREIA